MADRRKDAELNLQAQQSVGSVPSTLEHSMSLLSISMDAMDCAKFKVPRNLQATKEFQNAWRPEMMMLGAIVEGLTEHYILADQDMVKDSNLQCALIGLVLEESVKALQAQGRPIPCHLRIHTDNASGEGKNQTVFYLAAWMARRKLFQSVTLTQFRVGHSHGKPDQRFSEIRWALSQCSRLETPEHFAEAIESSVRPRENRSVKVHKVGASFDFKTFFQHLQLSTSGHTQTKGKSDQNVEAVHVFSFARREALSTTTQSAIEELSGKHPAPPDNDDIILSCRHHLAHSDESQKPIVFAAASDFDRLPSASSMALAPRAAFSDKQIKEFEKSALKISQAPWSMHEGSAYLLKLTTENQENGGDEWLPPEVAYLFDGAPSTLIGHLPPTILEEDSFKWNHTTPAPVTVQRAAKPKTQLRQKAAALSGAADSSAHASSRPKASTMTGAPATMYGRDGAPARVAVDPPAKKAKMARPAAAMKRPGAAAAAATSAPAVPASSEPGNASEPPTPPLSLPPPPSEISITLPSPAPSMPPSLPEDPPSPSAAGDAAMEAADDHAASEASPSAIARLRRPAAAKAPPKQPDKPKRKQLGRLPMPAGVQLGCPRCRQSKIGCAGCRKAAGLVLNDDESAWVFQQPQ